MSELVLVAKSMIHNLDPEIIQLGLGKYYQRYEYVERNWGRNIEEKDHRRLEIIWREIKEWQNVNGIEKKVFEVTVEGLVKELKLINERYARGLLLDIYPYRGIEFIWSELKEYRESIVLRNGLIEKADKIELFDAYFMLSQYVQIDNRYIRLLRLVERVAKDPLILNINFK